MSEAKPLAAEVVNMGGAGSSTSETLKNIPVILEIHTSVRRSSNYFVSSNDFTSIYIYNLQVANIPTVTLQVFQQQEVVFYSQNNDHFYHFS